MFSHITVGTNDFERGTEFYDAVIAVLDHACFVSGEGHRGYGQHNDNQFWVLSPSDKAAALANGGIGVTPDSWDEGTVRALQFGGGAEDWGGGAVWSYLEQLAILGVSAFFQIRIWQRRKEG